MIGSIKSAISKSASARLKSNQLVGTLRNAFTSEMASNTRVLPSMLHRATRDMSEKNRRDNGKGIVAWLVLLYSLEIRVGIIQYKNF